MGIRARIGHCLRGGTILAALPLSVVLLGSSAHAETKLIAIGSISGAYEDLAIDRGAARERYPRQSARRDGLRHHARRR